MTARTRTTKPASDTATDPRTDALAVIMAHAATLPTSAAIADFLGANGKSVRGRVRAGTLKAEDGSALAPVHVSRDGQTALTDAHKRAIAYTFAPADADACVTLAATVS
jgi:hypothetical protein